MYFSKKLYISPSLEKKYRRVKWKLRTGRPQPLIFVIALTKGEDLLEIYHSAMLKQHYYRQKEHSPYIVGIANGYSAAVDLVSNILCDVYTTTGGFDVKAYFR